MRRREFLATAAVTSMGITLGSAAASGVSPRHRVASPWRLKPFEFEEGTIAQLQQEVQRGRHSAVSILDAYLERLEDVDRRGPTLNSVIELNPDARAIARRLDQERKAGLVRGPLHGVPVLLKDNLDTRDRMRTTAGSLALAESTPDADAFVVRRLREAGAVVVGKTNLSEWANFRSTRSTSGWSGRGGLTRNPFVLDRNPCGSSSGSAVAVSANLCAVAVGTETNGSIICPASANGIVGLKPTLGLVSRTGIIPIADSQDTAGPMARTVTDAALLLQAMVGVDPADPAAKLTLGNVPPDYHAALDVRGLRGARLGVARRMFGFDARVDTLMEEALRLMEREGAHLVDLPKAFSGDGLWGAEHEVLLHEFKDGINRYLARRGGEGQVKSLKELIEFNERFRERELLHFGQELFVQAEGKGPLTGPAYTKALADIRRITRQEGIDAVVTEHRLDAVLAPAMGPTCVTDLVNGDHFSGGGAWVAACAGYPSLTVPVGDVRGLPVGLLLFGPAFSEATLLKLGYAFEQASRFRRAPRFMPTLV